MSQEINASFESFLGVIESEATKNDLPPADVIALADQIGGTVESFLDTHNIAKARTASISRATDTFGMENLIAMGSDPIIELVKAAGIPDIHSAQVVKQLGVMLGHHAMGMEGNGAWGIQALNEANHNPALLGGLVSMEQLFPTTIATTFEDRVAPSTESFGTTMDQAFTDMKIAITITLMKWHSTLTPRMLATLGTAQAVVTYTRNTLEVYNLDDTDTETTTNILDLYKDPSTVANELKAIVPLKTNDPGTELVADGIISFDVDVNILKLSIDAALYGHAKINRTDIVADGVELDKVHITLDDGVNPAETFELQVPESRARLTMVTNGQSSDRVADIKFRVLLKTTTETSAGAASLVLAAIGDVSDTVQVDVHCKPSIDLRTGVANAMCTYTMVAGNAVDGTTPHADTMTLVGVLNGTKTAPVGYVLDARYAEENMRKSDIAVTGYRANLSYQIPVGRNYVYDFALGDSRISAAENTAALNSVIRIGQDKRNLDLVEKVLLAVKDENAAYNADPSGKQEEPGRFYAAGCKVKPYVIQTTMDFTNITTDRDDVRFDIVKTRALSFLTSVIAEIHSNSMFVEQLTGQKVVYRVITSNEVMSNVLGAPHTHDHLNRGSMEPTNGVDLTVVLPSGVILEVITTSFDQMATRMIVIPFLAGQPKSELNFGHNWDYGTMVGNYNFNGDGSANQRLYANARELAIPTNVIGAVIDVTGLADISFRTP